jgi:Zn-finger nucleic acid-binding protein
MKYRPDEAAYACEFCGAVVLPARGEEQIQVLQPVPQTPCPACQLPLYEALCHGFSSYFCPACRGLLLEQDTFLQLIEQLRSRASGPGLIPPGDQPDLDRPCLLCPLCQLGMDNYPYQGPGRIRIDTCRPCHHIWLDGGEFNRIIDAPGRDRNQSGGR